MKRVLLLAILILVLSAVSVSAYYRCPDVTNDGIVNIFDLAAVGLHAISVCGEHLYNETFDINKDCAINESDLAIIGEWMGKTCLYICQDLNDDGVVNIFDMTIVTKNINSSCKFNKSADLNNDCIVNEIDLEILGDNYWCEGPDCIGDIDGDGEVDIHDLYIFTRSYNMRCYNETADVNKDCMVNETDTQIVEDWMGEICCRNGSTKLCGSDIGVCEKGLRTCIENEWSDCVGTIGPTNETCNGIDDDCDGLIDENLTQVCGSDTEICQSGMQTCTNGQWGDCIREIAPVQEICDGLDNDCDGEVDEIGCICTTDDTRPCGSDIGRCENGTQTCINRRWSSCIGAIGPANETCNGIDDNCNGLTDENLTQTCGSDTGECISGLQLCTNGVWGDCIGYTGSEPEICDSLDNDCDSTIDENLTRGCETENAKGACRYGYEICINGVWSNCTGSKSMEEICNEIDDDCDGLVDEEVCEIRNIKYEGKYTEKEAFLISDKNWKDILALVPVAIWTENNVITNYPVLIYHTERTILPFVKIRTINDIYNTTDNSWQSFIAEDDFISEIKVIGGFPGQTYHLQLQDLNGNVISNSDSFTSDNCYNSHNFSFNVKVNISQSYKIVWKVHDHGLICVSLSRNNPYPYGEFSRHSNYDAGMEIYGDDLTDLFDVDSVIHFMQQYKPSMVTIISDTPQELDNLLIANPEFGVGLNESQLQRISPNDYLSYWKSFTDVIYVEDNYTIDLMASTYASLLNIPLIIKGSSLDNENIFSGRNVILVGNIQCPDLALCSEQYELESLQKRYISLTNTDKIILVNHNDLNIAEILNSPWHEFVPEKSSYPIYKIFGEHSLTAPILAAAKHELIISTGSKNWSDIDKYIENKVESLHISPKYLTIIAVPNAIPVWDGSTTADMGIVADKIYATINETLLSVGRIFGITTSDVSSYIARVLFYQDLPKNKSNLFFIGLAFDSDERNAMVFTTVFNYLGYNVSNIIGMPTENPSDWENKNLILYMNHGGPMSVTNIAGYELPKLANTFIMAAACSTCAFDEIGKDYGDWLFCSRAIRNGAIGYVGAISVAGYFNRWKRLMNIFQNKTIGDSFKGIEEPFVLIGDPTIRLDIPYLLPDTKKIFFIEEKNKTLEYEVILKKGNFNGIDLYPYDPCIDIGPLNQSIMLVRSRWDPAHVDWHSSEMYYKNNKKYVHFCVNTLGGGVTEFADSDPVNITLFKEDLGFTYNFNLFRRGRVIKIEKVYASDLFEPEFTINVILRNIANETLNNIEVNVYDLSTFKSTGLTIPSLPAGEEKEVSLKLPSMAEQYPGTHELWIEVGM